MAHSLAAIPKAYTPILTQHSQRWILGTAVTGSLRKVTPGRQQVNLTEKLGNLPGLSRCLPLRQPCRSRQWQTFQFQCHPFFH